MSELIGSKSTHVPEGGLGRLKKAKPLVRLRCVEFDPELIANLRELSLFSLVFKPGSACTGKPQKETRVWPCRS